MKGQEGSATSPGEKEDGLSFAFEEPASNNSKFRALDTKPPRPATSFAIWQPRPKTPYIYARFETTYTPRPFFPLCFTPHIPTNRRSRIQVSSTTTPLPTPEDFCAHANQGTPSVPSGFLSSTLQHLTASEAHLVSTVSFGHFDSPFSYLGTNIQRPLWFSSCDGDVVFSLHFSLLFCFFPPTLYEYGGGLCALFSSATPSFGTFTPLAR